ncbi:hypothetical protein ANN_02989 [Periplaneta americana]|uniref:Transposase Tc1-like domain-containing protein n=1 Tax=Periplaneta americana TaxID=6978 RepID=A0ABQ8TXT1_PERAM|nr:hypothetical protein ANN_02989 [Periplaneta americana]
MSPRSSTDNYPAFAHIGLRENPGKNSNQVTCPNWESNLGHLVLRPDALLLHRFEDEILTDGKKKDLCKAINVIPTPTPVIEEWKISTIAIIVFTFVVLTCAGYFFYRKCWKKDPGRNNDEESHHNNTHIPVEHAPPPPYTPLLPEPSAPVRAMSLENVINYQEEKDTEVQQAVCFKDADYPYNSGSLEQEDDSEDNTPALEDENTMESNWSPPIGYGQEVVNVPCTINEVTESSSEPAETRPPSPSNTQDDSGVSNSSALSLPHRPFEGLGSSDSTSSSSLPVQPLVPTTTTTRPRSWSDEEVNASSSSKRARHDSVDIDIAMVDCHLSIESGTKTSGLGMLVECAVSGILNCIKQCSVQFVNMPRRVISTFTLASIVTLQQEELSVQEVSHWAVVHHSDVVRTCERYRVTQNVQDMPCSGSTTAAEDRYLQIMAHRNREENTTELHNAFLEATGTALSTQTVRNRLHTDNLASRHPTRTSLLQPQHLGSRNRWAKNTCNGTWINGIRSPLSTSAGFV